jgi:DNA-binding MarR family transcriptional regulator/GNAT superfamily N-acetyltransferase
MSAVSSDVAQVRRFNRIVTERVGALEARFVGRDLSLGEARVLWEIGRGGRDVRSLRTRLALDSGYLSRLLRALEQAGLVVIEPAEADRRVRVARLTPAGKREVGVLDARSDELAATLLEPLTAGQRERLVGAMGEVERLLTATMTEIGPMDPAAPDARHCLRSYFAEIDRRFAHGFDPARSVPFPDDEMRPPVGLLLVASLRGEPVGCGALRLHGAGEPAEIKRLWVAESARGLGFGRRLMAELEGRAAEAGAPAVRLDTNGALVEAIALYRSSGYVEIERFNAEQHADHWFEKELPARRRRSPAPAPARARRRRS